LGADFALVCLARAAYLGTFTSTPSWRLWPVDWVPFAVSGILFGLVAGISPGPMLALVVSETLRRNRRAGILVACAPLLTDAPIVIASVVVLSRLSQSNTVLGVISLLGALFLVYLAYGSLVGSPAVPDGSEKETGSLLKGVLANFLNPNPYLFWGVVGGPTILKASATALSAAVAFLICFYICLVGSKVAMALVVDRSRAIISTGAYALVIRGLGLALLAFAFLFFRDALVFFDMY
jgi:threonine/homoserine/homoserine lactone efflux protein